MDVVLGCDHAGFPLKSEVRDEIEAVGHRVLDVGTFDTTPVDYPDLAEAVAGVIAAGQAVRGILICGSGVGAAVAANKIRGIRAGVCHDAYSARQSVEHDDVNVLCLGARVVGPALARELVRAFLSAMFSEEERHVRRLQKIKRLEGDPGDVAAIDGAD